MKYTITLETNEKGEIQATALDEEKQMHTRIVGPDPYLVLRAMADTISDREQEFMESLYPGWASRRAKFKEWVTKSGEKLDELVVD